MEDISRGVRSFTAGTALSRVLGLVRESVFAALFGAGTAMDAFNVAFRIPNLLRDLFAETSLSAAFVPVLADEKMKGTAARDRLASNMLNTLVLVTALVSAAGILLSPWLSRLVAPGFEGVPGKIELTSRLTGVMFPFLLLVSLGAWAMSYLNAEKSFFIPSVAPAFFNLFSILVPVATFAWWTRRGGNPVFGMAWGVLAGGAMQFLVQVPNIFRKGFHYSLYLNFRDPGFRQVMTLFVPVAVGLAGTRINVLVNTILVTLLGEGRVSWLNYAYRVMHLPLGLFGIAVGAVALPSLSRLVLDRDKAGVRSTLGDSLKMVLFLTVPTSVFLAFLAHPVIRLIYERSRFTPEDTAATAKALVLYAVGIPFMGALRNVAAVFYAHKDAKTPMYASFASIGLNILLNATLMWIIGFLAFPLATTLAAVLNVGILLALLPKKIGRVDFGPLLRIFLSWAAAAAAGGAFGRWAHTEFLRRFGSSFLPSAAGLALGGLLALAVFLSLSRLLGIQETREYLRRFLRR